MSYLSIPEVLRIIKEDIADQNGKIIFCKGRYCGGKSKCSGLFYMDSKDNPIIKVAKGALKEDEWMGVLLHEYCHFLQWRDDSKVWNQFCDYDITYSSILNHPQKFKKQLVALIELELDCEKRVVRIIKKNNLFDEKEYIKSANAILYKYAFLYNFNKWPYDNRRYRKVIDLSPTKLLKSYKEYLDIPEKIINLYL